MKQISGFLRIRLLNSLNQNKAVRMVIYDRANIIKTLKLHRLTCKRYVVGLGKGITGL